MPKTHEIIHKIQSNLKKGTLYLHSKMKQYFMADSQTRFLFSPVVMRVGSCTDSFILPVSYFGPISFKTRHSDGYKVIMFSMYFGIVIGNSSLLFKPNYIIDNGDDISRNHAVVTVLITRQIETNSEPCFTVVTPSYLHNENSSTVKTASIYWNAPGILPHLKSNIKNDLQFFVVGYHWLLSSNNSWHKMNKYIFVIWTLP